MLDLVTETGGGISNAANNRLLFFSWQPIPYIAAWNLRLTFSFWLSSETFLPQPLQLTVIVLLIPTNFSLIWNGSPFSGAKRHTGQAKLWIHDTVCNFWKILYPSHSRSRSRSNSPWLDLVVVFSSQDSRSLPRSKLSLNLRKDDGFTSLPSSPLDVDKGLAPTSSSPFKAFDSVNLLPWNFLFLGLTLRTLDLEVS